LNAERALVVTRRVLRQLARDKRTVAILILQPLLIMAIFGYAFGGDVTGARVAVANLDRGTLASKVMEHLDHEVIAVVPFETELAVEQAVRRQEVRMGVVFPLNFTRNLEAGGGDRTAYLVIYKDNTNPSVTAAAEGEFLEAFADALEEEFDTRGAFDVDERVVFGGDDPESLEFFVPGIAGFTIFILSAFLTVVAVVKERTMGTLNRILVAPIKRTEVVLGYTIAFGSFSVLQALFVLGIATFVFGIPVRGSLALGLIVTTIVGFMGMGLGILISGVAESEYQAVQAVQLLVFPNMFLAGIFTPFEALPEFIRWASAVVPLTYAVRTLRAVINHGAGVGGVAGDLAILLVFAGVFFAAGAWSFGRQR